jgi:hypothetical protein
MILKIKAMSKHITLIALLILFTGFLSFGQMTATDFTATDCSGDTHHLFSELDSAKVVILVWVMPCPVCSAPVKTAFDTAQSFGLAYPGRVEFYIVDDLGNTDCSTLENWVTLQGIHCIAFSDSTIRTTDYGALGMPKTVVLGGANHAVYYVENNAVNGHALHNAIDSALTTVTGIDESNANNSQMILYPNPGQNNISLSGEGLIGEVKFDIYNLVGEKITTINSQWISQKAININTSYLSNGFYFLKATQKSKVQTVKFCISR